ncbi:MAG: MBL fold metallo-hydrolase [Prevotellaceae bacterium]|nr:MBL fold metallo-hydrolase [Prevotellaceae bacterium]
MIKIVTLIDNRKHSKKHSLEVEHGLSFYIETDQKKILLDVGASDKFFQNAIKLGIDIKEVDSLILSHAHRDHTGGLACFMQNNKKAKIYLSSNINSLGYYSNRKGYLRNISIDFELIQKNKERLVKVQDNMFLTSSIQIINKIPINNALPKANKTLFAGDKLDSFNHEMAVLLTNGEDFILLSSCTHMGLLNTLEACGQTYPTVFIGGMHLIDSDNTNQFESKSDLYSMGGILLDKYPNLQIYTGHCTGNDALTVLTNLMPNQLHTFYTGFEWHFNNHNYMSEFQDNKY